MMSKRAKLLIATSSFVALTTLGTGAAFAHVRDRGAPVTFSGFTSCNVDAKVTFSPPLRDRSTGRSRAEIDMTLSDCTNSTQDGVTLTGGHLQGFGGSVEPGTCSELESGSAPALSGGHVVWAPTDRVRPSADASVPTGRALLVATADKSFIQISYLDGSVASGSFANSRGTSVTVTSTQDVPQLLSRCSYGLSSVSLVGTGTL